MHDAEVTKMPSSMRYADLPHDADAIEAVLEAAGDGR